MENMWLRFYLRTVEEFRDREAIQRLFVVLLSLHYRLQGIYEPALVWDSRLLPAVVTPVLQHELEEYLAGHTRRLAISAYNVDPDLATRNLDFSMSFQADGDGYFPISIATDEYFVGDEDVMQDAYLRLLEMVKKVYLCLHPLYVHEFSWQGGGVDRAKVLNKEIRYLYGTNIFGPELVEWIGRERLLHAPAWRREDLDDGGILFVPSERFAQQPLITIDAAAQALGMEPAGDPDVFFVDEYEEEGEESEE